jgi:hypothetical protein
VHTYPGALSGRSVRGRICKERQKRIEQHLFGQLSFPVLNIAINPDPERQTTLMASSNAMNLSNFANFRDMS